jgi:hypothetical protein
MPVHVLLNRTLRAVRQLSQSSRSIYSDETAADPALLGIDVARKLPNLRARDGSSVVGLCPQLTGSRLIHCFL